MKNLKFTFNYSRFVIVFILTMILFAFYSCSDSDSEATSAPAPSAYQCVTCKTSPDAKPENDNSYKGVYIGVTSFGSVVVDIQNNDKNINATLVLDGVRINLTANEILAGRDGVYEAVFTGIYNGNDVSFNFSTKEDGSSPKISSTSLPELYINKEKSDALIEVFEGIVYSSKIDLDVSPMIGLGRITNDPSTEIQGKYNILVYRSIKSAYYKTVPDIDNGSWWRGVGSLNGITIYNSGSITDLGQLIDKDNHYNGTLNVDELKGRGLFLGNFFDSRAYLIAKRIL